LLLLVAFAIGLVFTAPKPADAGMIAITEADNGREFTLSRGDVLEVLLTATSGTGYTWQAVPIADALVRQVGEMKFRADRQIPGASGHQVFRFSVEESGTGSVEFRYVRPWEKDTPPAKVFKILLIVK
jgi:inhibitor of cysteine peptidase